MAKGFGSRGMGGGINMNMIKIGRASCRERV